MFSDLGLNHKVINLLRQVVRSKDVLTCIRLHQLDQETYVKRFQYCQLLAETPLDQTLGSNSQLSGLKMRVNRQILYVKTNTSQWHSMRPYNHQ